MAAYRTAARRFPGLHQPLVGMGMEYARMNNLLLSEQMLHAAHTISPSDPLVLHELGVMAFKMGDDTAAEGWFGRALTMQSSALSPGGCLRLGILNRRDAWHACVWLHCKLSVG